MTWPSPFIPHQAHRPLALHGSTLPALASALDVLGGVAGLQALVQRSCQLMDELDELQARPQRSAPWRQDREQRLFEFLSDCWGGPSLYADKQTPPRLRLRHAPATPGAFVRDEWMLCLTQALCDRVSDMVMLSSLLPAVELMADHLMHAHARALNHNPETP